MMVGRYLARGLAGETDVEQARQWSVRAVEAGVVEAQQDLAAMPRTPRPLVLASVGAAAPQAV
jgi:hypothetical protein